MEQIWTALTTENPILITQLSIPLTLIEIFVTIRLATTILDIDVTKKKLTIYFIVMTILSIFYTLFIPKTISSVLQLIVIPVCVGIIFRPGIIKSILVEFIPLAFIVVLDLLLDKIYSIIFHLNYNLIYNIPIYRVSLILIIYFVIYLLYRILKRFHINVSIIDSLSKSRKRTLILNLLLAAFVIASEFYLGMFYNNNLPLTIVLLNIMSLLAYFVVSITTFIRTAQLETTSQNLEEEKSYNKTLTILHDKIRGFKHDFDNIVQAIGGYVETNDMEGLKEYYSHLQKDSARVNNLSLLNPSTINNPAIYSLLTSKYFTAKDAGIEIENFEVFADFKELEKHIRIYELSRILGILFDNAIDASKESDEKVLNLWIRNEPNRNRYIIKISNSYKDKSVDTDRIYEKGFSSKGENRGLGLWEVRQFIKKSKNLNLFTTKDDEYFTQQLEIYYS